MDILPRYDDIYNNLNNDQIEQRIRRENVNGGELQISLIWNDIADLDLHVITPSNEEIFFGHKESRCGGWLDIDMNAGSNHSLEPIENVFWASSPNGRYKVFVKNYNNRTKENSVFMDINRKVPYRVKMIRNNNITWFNGLVGYNEKEVCFEFDQTDGSGAVGSFIILEGQNEKMTIEEHCKKNNLPYIKGTGMYCLQKKENISEKKDLILYKKDNDTFIIGRLDVLNKLGLQNIKMTLKPDDLPDNYVLYVQSTSVNRGIQSNTKILIKASMRDVLRFRRNNQYNL